MKATVKWVDGVSFTAESGTGHSVVMDGPPDHGGRDLGPRPMEMLVMGLGGCASFDVLSMLKKSRQNVEACVAEVVAERADAVPAVFTKIHLNFVVTGPGLKESLVTSTRQTSSSVRGHVLVASCERQPLCSKFVPSSSLWGPLPIPLQRKNMEYQYDCNRLSFWGFV